MTADQFDGIIPKEGVIVYRVQTTDPFATRRINSRRSRC